MNKYEKDYDVTVIGGGPAGLAAATAASKDGAKVLLVEREERLGGVLKQCIHDGFGVIKYGEKLSGCEYACRAIHQIQAAPVDIWTLTFASEIVKEEDYFRLTLTRSSGIEIVRTKTLVFATGCRERTARQVAIHGSRPAGVITAGSAQYYINILGHLPGRNCVILGSGDIGLIMARRLTLEGSKVIGVYEAKAEPSGLNRNIYQCLTDFNIPLHLSETVTGVHGRGRVESVTVSKVDENMQPIKGTEREIPCDTLILSVGLIPENELAETLDIKMSPATKGAICDETYMTSVPGVFACGNALHVNDLVDYVSESGDKAGLCASQYARRKPVRESDLAYFDIEASREFLYTVPERISKGAGGMQDFFFRSRRTRGASRVVVTAGEKQIYSKVYQALRPPEIEKITVDFTEIDLKSGDKIKFEMEDCEE